MNEREEQKEKKTQDLVIREKETRKTIKSVYPFIKLITHK